MTDLFDAAQSRLAHLLYRSWVAPVRLKRIREAEARDARHEDLRRELERAQVAR